MLIEWEGEEFIYEKVNKKGLWKIKFLCICFEYLYEGKS